MSLRRSGARSGRNVGFAVRGCGSVAASSAACSAPRREAGTPKYARLAASIPQMPGPHSATRSEEHTSELQSQSNLVCRLLLEKKKKTGPDDRLGLEVADWVSTQRGALALDAPLRAV